MQRFQKFLSLVGSYFALHSGQRDNHYDLLRVHDGNDSPDLAVTHWSLLRAKPPHRKNHDKSKAPVAVTVGQTAIETK